MVKVIIEKLRPCSECADAVAFLFTAAQTRGVLECKPLTQVVFVCFLSEQSHADANTFFYLLIVSSIISSLYTLIWDLRMDWGLFDRGAGENIFLREEIVYPHKVASGLIPVPVPPKQTLTPSALCPGLLLLCYCGRCDPAFCLDDPDFSDHNDQDQLCGRHLGHHAGSS